jgi:hypothetical protein
MIAVDAASCGEPLTGRADIDVAILPGWNSDRENVPSSRRLLSQTGCGTMPAPVMKPGTCRSRRPCRPRAAWGCPLYVLVIGARGRRFDIDNDGMLDIDQIETVTEQHACWPWPSGR